MATSFLWLSSITRSMQKECENQHFQNKWRICFQQFWVGHFEKLHVISRQILLEASNRINGSERRMFLKESLRWLPFITCQFQSDGFKSILNTLWISIQFLSNASHTLIQAPPFWLLCSICFQTVTHTHQVCRGWKSPQWYLLTLWMQKFSNFDNPWMSTNSGHNLWSGPYWFSATGESQFLSIVRCQTMYKHAA